MERKIQYLKTASTINNKIKKASFLFLIYLLSCIFHQNCQEGFSNQVKENFKKLYELKESLNLASKEKIPTSKCSLSKLLNFTTTIKKVVNNELEVVIKFYLIGISDKKVNFRYASDNDSSEGKTIIHDVAHPLVLTLSCEKYKAVAQVQSVNVSKILDLKAACKRKEYMRMLHNLINFKFDQKCDEKISKTIFLAFKNVIEIEKVVFNLEYSEFGKCATNCINCQNIQKNICKECLELLFKKIQTLRVIYNLLKTFYSPEEYQSILDDIAYFISLIRNAGECSEKEKEKICAHFKSYLLSLKKRMLKFLSTIEKPHLFHDLNAVVTNICKETDQISITDGILNLLKELVTY